MPFTLSPRSLDNVGNKVCHLDAGTCIGPNEVQRVDRRSQRPSRNLTITPILHLRHHRDGAELLLFCLVGDDDLVLSIESIYLLE